VDDDLPRRMHNASFGKNVEQTSDFLHLFAANGVLEAHGGVINVSPDVPSLLDVDDVFVLVEEGLMEGGSGRRVGSGLLDRVLRRADTDFQVEPFDVLG